MFKNIYSIKIDQNNLQEMYSEDSLGKEEIYFRKITTLMFEIIIVAIMKLCLFKTNYMQIYIFMGEKNKKQHKHSR